MRAFAGLLLLASTCVMAAAPSNETAVREAIARDIAKKIETEMQYPGEIKVTLIR